MATETVADPPALQLELRQLRNDIAKISEIIGGLARQRASDAVGKAQETLGAAVDKARSGAQDVADAIHDRPLSSAATAVGLGAKRGR